MARVHSLALAELEDKDLQLSLAERAAISCPLAWLVVPVLFLVFLAHDSQHMTDLLLSVVWR